MLSVPLEDVSFDYDFIEFRLFFTVFAPFVLHCFMHIVELTSCSSI